MSLKVFKYLNENNRLPPKGTPVAELGCGFGDVLEAFYRNGYNVSGIDKDKDGIDSARLLMPNGSFEVGDLTCFTVPARSFVIIRNVLPFLASKAEVESLLKKLIDHKMIFTLFGPNDVKASIALSWTRDEVEDLCKNIGASVVEAFDGESLNLRGEPRRSHIFTCLK